MTTKIDPVRGEGYVVSVNQPGNSGFDKLTIRADDEMRYATYAPQEDDYLGATTWFAAGQQYNMFIIDSHQSPGTQGFIVWSSREDGYLRKAHNPVYAIGAGEGGNTLKKGDKVQLRWSGDDAKMVDVTVDVFRENHATATFSFKTPNPYYHP